MLQFFGATLIPVATETWVVVKIMVPFWVPNIIWHLLFRVPKYLGYPKKDPYFDNYPHEPRPKFMPCSNTPVRAE